MVLLVHISDIHIESDQNQIDFIQLYDSIKHEIHLAELIIFVFSGDIAFSGRSNQYEIFHTLLKQLETRIRSDHGEKNIQYVITPGNHDCDFETNSQIRLLSISSIKKLGNDAIGGDSSVIDTCTSVQDSFFNLLYSLSDIEDLKGIDKLWYKIEIASEHINFEFNCFNTSWLSSRKEDPGSLFFPVARLGNMNNQTEHNRKTLRIAVYHHPDNWLSPNYDEANHKEFRNMITRNNDLVLSGHEHLENVSEYNSLTNGFSAIFHESDAYFKNGIYGGFNLFKFNDDGLNNLEMDYYCYDNQKGIFFLKDSRNKCLSENLLENRNFELVKSFKSFLDDNDVFLSNPTSKELTLRDVFTYPKLQKISTGEIVNSEIILKDQNLNEIVIFGADQSGKTSLLKQLFSYWYYDGYTPIYIDCKNDIKNENIRQSIKNTYKKQYEERKKNFDDYLALDLKEKILLIDNYHLLNPKMDRGEIIKKLRGFSNKIIILADDIASLDEASLGSEQNENIEKYTLLQFGNINREKLIEKWFEVQGLSGGDLFQKKVSAHNRINDILGANLVPSYPLFILTILQALEANTSSRTEITSYGHCYQTLIYLSLKKNGMKDDDFDSIDNFLSFVAFFLFEKKHGSFSDYEIEGIYSDYCKNYVIGLSLEKVMELLVLSRIILSDSMGNYRFKYVYIYYFYTAKYISAYKLDDKGFIEKLCENIVTHENSFIILFLTHHTNDRNVLDTIIMNTMSELEEFSPITLSNEETDFMTDFVKSISDTVIENIRPEEYREKQLEIKDNEEANQNKVALDDYSKTNKDIERINRAFKSLEINGQILKNQFGKISIGKLEEIIEESFLICFRLLKFLVNDLSREETKNIIVDQIEDVYKKNNHPSTPSREKLYKAVSDLLSNITYYICHYTLDKSAYSLGNKTLIELYKKISNKIDTPASKLTYFLIKSKFGDRIDRNEISRLKSEFSNNSFALSILRRATINFIYMHHLESDDKNWLASTLGLEQKEQRKIENTKQG